MAYFAAEESAGEQRAVNAMPDLKPEQIFLHKIERAGA